MPSNFVVIHGDAPKVIAPDESVEFPFGFPQKERPAEDKPAMLVLNVQSLIEPSEVLLNGSSIGRLSPVTGFILGHKFIGTTELTSPTYNPILWSYMTSGGARYGNNPTIQQFLDDVEVRYNLDDPELQREDFFYWSTQMININIGEELNRFSPSSGDEIYEATYKGKINRLRISSVSKAFKVKDIFLNYPIAKQISF